MKSNKLPIVMIGALVVAVFALGAGAALAGPCSVPSSSYPTIQSAVSDATCDPINVAAGLYAENITINRSLTLLGAGANVPPTAGGRGGGESRVTSALAGDQIVFTINASDVTVNGFEIPDAYTAISTLSDPGGTPLPTYNNLTFSYNWIHSNAMWRGIALNFNHSSDFNGVIIDHNLMSASAPSPSGVVLIGMSGSATYSNIVISNNDLTNPLGRWLFNGGNPAGYLINTMSITDNVVHAGGFNIGNINNGTVSDNVFNLKGGYIGIDTGTISGNSFTGGAYLGLFGTQCCNFARPSKNLTISHNAFGPDSVLYLDDAGVDIASLHVNKNSFFQPSGPKACVPATGDETGYIVYGSDPASADTLDATYNWWGVNTGAGDAFGCGLLATSAPWISAYVDDGSKAGQPGFWPLVLTTTTIDSDTPDPSLVSSPYTVSGTVEVTGLGGVTANLAALPSQVKVSDGTDSCTDLSLTASATLNKYAFSCGLTSTTVGPKTLTATFTDTSADPFYNTSSGTAAHEVNTLTKKDCKKAVEDQKKAFDQGQQTDKKNFDQGQQTDKKNFDQQQQVAKENFDATHPSPQDRKAFDDQQHAAKKTFDDNQKDAKKTFDDNQKAAKKAFDDQNKADDKACDQLPK